MYYILHLRGWRHIVLYFTLERIKTHCMIFNPRYFLTFISKQVLNKEKYNGKSESKFSWRGNCTLWMMSTSSNHPSIITCYDYNLNSIWLFCGALYIFIVYSSTSLVIHKQLWTHYLKPSVMIGNPLTSIPTNFHPNGSFLTNSLLITN